MIAHIDNEQPNTQLPNVQPMLEQMVRVIVEVTKPEKVILFGSRAKGTAKDDADYDFLIIDANPFGKDRSRRQEISKVSRALASFRVSIDLLIHSIDEVDYWSLSLNHVIGRALREGTVLYERH